MTTPGRPGVQPSFHCPANPMLSKSRSRPPGIVALRRLRDHGPGVAGTSTPTAVHNPTLPSMFPRERHGGQPVMDGLERTNGYVELLAFLRVGEGHLEDATGSTDHLGRGARVGAVAPTRVIVGCEGHGVERREVEDEESPGEVD